MAAKGKKHKNGKKDREPRTRTVSRVVRGPLTQTFTDGGPFTIPAPSTTKGPAAPYPSAIEVSGFANGVVTDVDLVLQDFTHGSPFSVDVLLSKDDGRRALVMSDVGSVLPVTNIDLTLDDEAAQPPIGQLDSGNYRPFDDGTPGPDDTFAAPAPAPDGRVALSTFDGANPNGTWRLWVMDESSALDVGDIRGWALRITAEVDTGTVDERPRGDIAKKDRKRKKGRR